VTVADSLPVTDEVDDLLAATQAAGMPAGSGPAVGRGRSSLSPLCLPGCRTVERPTRVTGHGRRLTAPVDVQLRGNDATERQARHFG
jgi:hypothetical protein